MARKIDFSKPLSDEDAQYVLDRPWLIRDAELDGVEVTFEDEFVVEDDGSDDNGGDGDNGENGDESGDSDGNDDQGNEDDENEAVDYSTWEYADLKDEAGRREMSKAGSKEQLIARLIEDDEARAAESGEDDEEETE